MPTLLEAWNRVAEAHPGAVALVEAPAERTWTRAALDTAAAEWAEAHGGGLSGRTVILAEATGVEWMRVFLGLLKSDAVVVPLDPGEPAAARRLTAERIGAAFLWNGTALEAIRPRSRRAHDGRRIVKLTSGTTGRPRPLPFTDRQLIADGRQICSTMGIAPQDLNLGMIPFSHSYGFGNLVTPLLLQGTGIVLAGSPLPQAVAAAVERWRATVFPAVPPLLRALAGADVPPGRLRSLRTVLSAGSALPAELARAFRRRFGIPVHNFYGSTETGGIAYDRSGEATLEGRSIGTPMDGVRLAFQKDRRFVVRSAAVYTLGNPMANARRGAHRPGDLGERNALGELVLLGRSGRILKVAGRRLDPAEVEGALRAVAGVADAFVAAHPRKADALAALVAGGAAEEAIRSRLGDTLAPWKIPKLIRTVPEFPATVRGKPDLRKLEALLARS